jgi:hypothetical protein
MLLEKQCNDGLPVAIIKTVAYHFGITQDLRKQAGIHVGNSPQINYVDS